MPWCHRKYEAVIADGPCARRARKQRTGSVSDGNGKKNADGPRARRARKQRMPMGSVSDGNAKKECRWAPCPMGTQKKECRRAHVRWERWLEAHMVREFYDATLRSVVALGVRQQYAPKKQVCARILLLNPASLRAKFSLISAQTCPLFHFISLISLKFCHLVS